MIENKYYGDNELRAVLGVLCKNEILLKQLNAILDSIPTADVVEVRHGEWIDTGDFELDNIYSGLKCSLCGYIFCGSKTNYCAGCGAHMKGGE